MTGAIPLRTVVAQWGRIGLTGFGGPPAHIALLRKLVVTDGGWLTERELEEAIATCNLLPGPASTQLAIYTAYRVAGRRGALAGGLAFVVPAVAIVLALSVLFLAGSPPAWVRGAGAGAGSAVAAVAVQAGLGLAGPSRAKALGSRWWLYLLVGCAGPELAGQYLVLTLLACGLLELGLRSRGALPSVAAAVAVPSHALGPLAWTAIKVGLLSFGGGFVIVPLMQADAVHVNHWMTQTHFLNAVALGQVTPGPVVATIAAVGYAAHGIGGGALAAAIAFTPSFAFVLFGGRSFGALRGNAGAQAFLAGAGPAAIGAIIGSAIPLTLALTQWWQGVLLGLAALALLAPASRLGVVSTLLGAGGLGALAALLGAPVG